MVIPEFSEYFMNYEMVRTDDKIGLKADKRTGALRVAPDNLSLPSLLKAPWVHSRLIHRAFCVYCALHYAAYS